MAAHGDPERYFRETADRICDGAEDELVARLTSEALDMMEKAVTNPDRYQVLARLAPQALMGVLAEHRPHLEDDVARAVWEALKREDDALEAILAAKKANAAAGAATDYAKIYATQAAKGVTEILQRQNVALVDHLASLWYRVAGNAVTRAILGDSRRAVMEDAVRALADGGLETVDYRSRRRTSVDAATRRHIVTQANQARNRLLTQRCSQYGCELVMTSAHYGARPDHAVWQGKAYGLHGPVTVDGVRYPGLAASTGYGTVTGLAGANCRHTMTPYVPGLSKLPRTDWSAEERLHGMTSDEYYGATQVQRRLEREVRRCKRRIALGQERGLDMAADRAALGRAQGRVRQWCRQNGLPRRYDLERAYGVARQPRALGAISVEQPLVPKGPGGAFAVNRKVVNSSGYRSRIEGLPIPKKAAAGVRREVGRILTGCDGTQHERVSAVEWGTGRLVADNFARTASDGRAALTWEQAEACAKARGGVVLVHNHPASGRPSFTDIETVAANGFVRGSVVACHDGTVFFLQSDHGSLAGVYNEIKKEIAAINPGLSGDEVDAFALDVIYGRNEEERWFRLKKR